MSLDLNWRLVKDSDEFTSQQIFDTGCALMLIGVPSLKTEADVQTAARRVIVLDRVASVFDGKMNAEAALRWARRWRGLQSNALKLSDAQFMRGMREQLETEADRAVSHELRMERGRASA